MANIKWSIVESIGKDPRITLVHSGGRTVLRVESDLGGDRYFVEEGPEVDEDDLDELKTDYWRYQGSAFGPIRSRYRSDVPL